MDKSYLILVKIVLIFYIRPDLVKGWVEPDGKYRVTKKIHFFALCFIFFVLTGCGALQVLFYI